MTKREVEGVRRCSDVSLCFRGKTEELNYMRDALSVEITFDYAGSHYLLVYSAEVGNELPIVCRWGKISKFFVRRLGWHRLSEAPLPVIDKWHENNLGHERRNLSITVKQRMRFFGKLWISGEW